MHQDAANCVRSEAGRLIPSAVDAFGDADRFRLLALIAELGCVVQHKNETVTSGGTIKCRLEMASQNVRFADPVIREEAVGCLGIRPILADERNALSHGASNLREQFAESVAEPRVLKLAFTTLSINPTFSFQGPQTTSCRSILSCQPHRAPLANQCSERNHKDSFD